MRSFILSVAILACVWAHESFVRADADAAPKPAGSTYYVDFDRGADKADGLSPQSPFKHSPGDPAAEGKAKAAALAPGDAVIFKGGVVYRGTITASASGREGQPIVYNGNTAGTFGAGRAIVDGSEDLTLWKQCASAEEAAGNPNWKNLYWAPAPKGAGVFTINLCEGNVTLPIAQDPDPADPFFEDVVSTYRPVLDPQPAPLPGAKVTVTVYRDPGYFTQKDPHAWDGGYFALHGRPNMIYYQRVQSYDPASGTLTMDLLKADQYPTKGDTIGRYSMMNALAVLDRPGEFVVDEKPRADGTQRVWLWPLERPQGSEGPRGVTYSVRPAGFTVSGVSYVTVEGFLIRKQGGKPNAYGITGAGKGASDIVVRDNEVTLVRANRNQVIGITDAKRVTISGNYVHECRRAGAIALDRCTDSLIANNRLHKNGATCLLMYRSHNIRVEHNTISDHKGMHANGLTAYVNCSDITFAYNRVTTGNAAITLQEGQDMLVHHNIFDGGGMGLWGVATLKNIRFYNNLFLHSDPKSDWALAVYCGGKGEMIGYEFKNNVIDGIYREGEIVAVHDHNVYTRPGVAGLKTNTWKMGEAEVLEPDLKKLFVDPDKGDYRPRPGGPLDGKGVDVGLKEDFAGTKVPEAGAPSIGAYQK